MRFLERRSARLALAISLGCLLAACAAPLAAAPAKTPAKAAARAPAKKSKPAAAPRRAPEPAAAPAPAEDPVQASWKLARGLADQKQHAEALRVLEVALEDHPGSPDLLWLQAGVTGEAGRHREAIALYEQLMTRHPELARDLRADLATQRLWAGDAAGAVRDFELRLEESPGDGNARRMRALALSHADRLPEALAAYEELIRQHPGEVDLQLERARVLAWMGRNRKAADAYGEILARHPDHERARLGLAQNENWSGNHRRAVTLYEEMRQSGNRDPEVTKGLAYAYYWDGRSDQSRAALDDYLAQRPQDQEGLALRRMLAREGSPTLTGGVERSDDSDALRIRTSMMEYRRPLGRQAAVLLRWRRDNIKDSFGNRDPLQIGAGVEKGWGDRWAMQLFASWYRPETDVDADALGELNLTHRPADRLRIDAGFAKDHVLTRESLERGIAVRIATVGFDWRFSEKAMLSAAERWRLYSDGNQGNLTSGALLIRAITQPRWNLSVRLGVQHLQNQETPGNGYYSPERYVEYGPGVVYEWRPAERVRLGFDGKVGQQEEKGSDAQEFHSYTAEFEFPLGSALSVHLIGGRSNSNLTSASGFKQNRWAAYLTTRL